MTKQDLIENVAQQAGLSKRQAGDAVDAALTSVTKSLAKGMKVTITGFGTFMVSKRAARKGVNPRTGQQIQIKAMNTPRFKAGKALKDAVR